jgi:hypothetical protein
MEKTPMTDIDYDLFVRKPFAVKATRITEENIDAVAELVGEVRVKDGQKFIALNRRIVPNVGRAFIGWYLTVLDDNLRCYSAKIFKDQFIEAPESGVLPFTVPEEDDVSPVEPIDVV